MFDFIKWPNDTAVLIGFENEDIELICHHFKGFFIEESIEMIINIELNKI